MALFLFLLFIVLPVAELYVIIQVGQWIGVLPTLALMMLSALVGAALARSQGRQVWRRFNEMMRAGRVPGREVFDGAMIVFGGALLLSPGFITDALGILLLLPPSRAAIRGMLKRAAARTPSGRPVLFFYERMPGTGRPSGPASRPADAGPAPGPAAASPRPSRSYDVEGSARELDESEYHLPEGAGDD